VIDNQSVQWEIHLFSTPHQITECLIYALDPFADVKKRAEAAQLYRSFDKRGLVNQEAIDWALLEHDWTGVDDQVRRDVVYRIIADSIIHTLRTVIDDPDMTRHDLYEALAEI